MIAVYSSDSLQAQIVQAICAAHRIEARMLDPRVKLARHLGSLKDKGVRLALIVIELADLQRNGYSVQSLRAALKAGGGRGKVALLMPHRIAIDPLIERWASVDQGAIMAIPAMNLGQREESILPVANEIAGVLGVGFDSRKTGQFVSGLNPAAFANHTMARLHMETNRLAREGVLLADMIDWLDRAGSELTAENRQYMLKTFEECLLGTDIVASIAEHWQVDHERALDIGNWMVDAGFLYHVAREQRLQDTSYFYRLSWPSERLKPIRLAKAVVRMADPNLGVDVADRSHRTRKHANCFVGAQAVAWLRSTLSIGLGDAICCGQTLMHLGLIRHVHDEPGFLDSESFFRFAHLDSAEAVASTDPAAPVTV